MPDDPSVAVRPVRFDRGTFAMTRFAFRHAAPLTVLAALLCALPCPATAQYFGRNKVQYEKFDWRVMRTPHFDLYFYPAESLVTHDAGRLAERWYTRHSDIPSTASRSCSTRTSPTFSRPTWSAMN
jgi:hypothetical protein